MDILNSETYKVAVTIVKDFSPIISMLSAGFGAVIGLYWTNKWQDKRLKSQIDREDQRKRLEKNLEIQKDVFLGTVEAIQRLADMMFKYADLNANMSTISAEFLTKKSYLAQVHLIASSKLLQEITKIATLSNEHIFELTIIRHQLKPYQDKLEELERQKIDAQKKRDEVFLQSGMVIMDLPKLSNPDPIDHLLDEIKHHIHRINLEIENISIQFNPLKLELYKKAVQANYEILCASINLNIIARQEIGALPLQAPYEKNMAEAYFNSRKKLLDLVS